MNIARSFLIIAAIATLVAVALGMGTYTHTDFTSIHMVFGLIVALALLILAVIAVFSKGLIPSCVLSKKYEKMGGVGAFGSKIEIP